MTDTKKRLIIKYKSDVTTAQKYIESMGATIISVNISANLIIADIPVDKISTIAYSSDIQRVEADGKADVLGFLSEQQTQTVAPQQQIVPWGISKIRAQEVQSTGNKGTGIKVAIIDTGIDYTHPDISANYKGGYNFLTNTTDPMDDHGHGTHVAGTIAALDNDIGVLGVTPEASIYALKVLDSNGSGSYSDIITAIQWCIDNKMQVISMSLGGSSFNQGLQDICDAAYNANIIIIAAAGNSGSDTDTILYPAKFDSVIAVGATDSNDNRASFSSVGAKLEVSAPGVNVLSTVPNGTCKLCNPSGYNTLNGTSMATPHATGTAALILHRHPEFTNKDVRTVLGTTSMDLGQPGRDIFYGFGRIDAKAAVDNTQPPTPPPTTPTPTPTPEPAPTPQPPQPPQPPQLKYRCLPDLGICILDPNGDYPDLQSCQNACRQQTKFSVTSLGNIGVLVQKLPTGTLTADQACTTACQIIKAL